MLKIWFALVAITAIIIAVHSQNLNSNYPTINKAVEEMQEVDPEVKWSEFLQKQDSTIYP